MSDGIDLPAQWRQRCSTAALVAARVARRAAGTTDEAAVALRASASTDWTGRAAEGYRDRTRALLQATTAAGGSAEELAAHLAALARAVEQLP